MMDKKSTGEAITKWAICSYLDQQSDGTTFIHLQDLSVLSSHQDVAVAQRYGTYGGVVFQQQPCRVRELKHWVRVLHWDDSIGGALHFS